MKHKRSQAPTIIVLGESFDTHVPAVKAHLSQPLILVDPADIAAGKELSYSFHKGEPRITYEGQSLDNISAVWVRGLRVPGSLSVPVHGAYQDYARDAILRHTDALYTHFKDALWVSDYFAIRRADYKPLQLELAASLGFKIPDTIFTSSPARARAFIDKYPVTITKSIANKYPVDKEKGTGLLFFAKRIKRGDNSNFSGLHLAPAIFQQAIEPVADLRVTVIGDHIFPISIVDEKVDSASSIRDWRIGHDRGKLRMEPYDLPKDIADKCLAHVKALGLNYGAIDLIIDKKGQIWFLENNPNGQWLFVEHETGLPLSKAMADLLQGKQK